jgi:transcriptional regulator with GAF, ATPase, and Fis domain
LTKKSTDFNILRFVLKDILKTFRESANFQSVAIRLRKEGDFPYFLHMGFPEIFVSKETTLNIRDRKGNLILDADSTPFVECMCGNVLKRRVNPKYPYFTKDGAFWTNSTTQLLESLTEEERQEIGKTRNTCHDYGYESVALIPVHANGEIIGLIQINDSREGMFTLEKVEKCQLLADQIGTIAINIIEVYEKIAQAFKPASELENVEK